MKIGGWEKRTLLQMCELKAGSAFKTHFQGKSTGDVPFIKVSDMNNSENAIAIRSANNWVSFADAKAMKAKPLPFGTTVFAKIGEALRQNRVRKLLRETIVDNNMMGAVPRSDVVRSDYLYYLLSNFDIASTANGTALPYLTVSVLGSCEFLVPSLMAQREIASILSAYDDLIENNTRRIAVLEEMARRIYEEWFIHFRAPGSETLPRINTPLGPVPEGWEVMRLDQIVEVNPEQISPKNPPDQIAYIDIASVSPGRIDQVVSMPFADAPGRARRIVRDGDTLWSCVRPNRRSHALVIDPESDWVASTGFAVLRPREPYLTFLYFTTTAESFVSYLVGRATGSAYPAVKASDFEEALLIKPPDELLTRFCDCVDPMVRLGANLHRQNRNLRAQRDLLLPKLISGEIDVSEAPAFLEAAE